MTALESVQFSLAHVGETILLDPTLGATFVSAVGQYQSPDKVHATVKAEFGGTILELELLWVPEGNFISNPLTGTYEPLPDTVPLNPAALFDPDSGLGVLLSESIQELQLVGIESIEGTETRHINGTTRAEDLSALVPTPISGDLGVDVWITLDSAFVVRIVVTQESGDTTTLGFFAFDEPVAIPSPN